MLLTQVNLIHRMKQWVQQYYPGTKVGVDKSQRTICNPSVQSQCTIATYDISLPPSRHQIALTEYSWGAERDMNGATAQADILGILGREGVDLATRWTCPDASTPTYQVSRDV